MKKIDINKYYNDAREHLASEIEALEKELANQSASEKYQKEYLLKKKKTELELLEEIADYPRFFCYHQLLDSDKNKYISLRKAELSERILNIRIEKGTLLKQFRDLHNEYKILAQDEEANKKRCEELEIVLKIIDRQISDLNKEKAVLTEEHQKDLSGVDKDILFAKLLSEFEVSDLQKFRHIPSFKRISKRDLAIYQMMQTADGYSKLLEVIDAIKHNNKSLESVSVAIDIPNSGYVSFEEELAEDFKIENHQIIASPDDVKVLQKHFAGLEFDNWFSDILIRDFHPDKLMRILNASDLKDFNSLFRAYRQDIPEDLYFEFANSYETLRELENKFIVPKNAKTLRASLMKLARKIRLDLANAITERYRHMEKVLGLKFIVYPASLENIIRHYDDIVIAFDSIQDDIYDLKEKVELAAQELRSQDISLVIENQKLINRLTTATGIPLNTQVNFNLTSDDCDSIYLQVYIAKRANDFEEAIASDIKSVFATSKKTNESFNKSLTMPE